jgi:thiamine transport system substrate-binding protein
MKKLITVAAIAALTLTGCAAQEPTTVRIATHDSFVISDELIAEFESTSGFELEIVRLGDTGSLANQLVLTKNAPIADAFFGIDNTTISVANENDLLGSEPATIDFSDVCFNYDIAWFEENSITPPTSWRDLGDAKYSRLTVISNPALSSPALAFLATTHAGFETEAEVFAYWRSLRDNGLKVVGGWEDAYFIDFTRYGGNYPIVLSYASSPAAEVNEDGTAGSASLLDECFRQVEYAGVLKKAANKNGAEALVSFLESESFQKSVPEAMYVYPASSQFEGGDWAAIAVPASWAEFAPPARTTIGGDLDFVTNRERWITDWSDVFDN